VKGSRAEGAEPGTDKREAILSTALRLFTERGFHGTPTSLISQEAGVATGTLFFYFKTKEELIDTLYRTIKSEAGTALKAGVDAEPTIDDKIRRVGLNAVSWGIKNREKIQFMEQFAHSPFVSSTAHDEGMSHFLFLKDLIRDGIRQGVIRDYDPGLLLHIMAASFSGLIGLALKTPGKKERKLIIGQGLEYIGNGIRNT
jgi:AcrR family transcriptional regulator